MKKYAAEFLGTLFLALAVNLSLAQGDKFPVPTAVVAALTLGVAVYTLGAISGTHINPAITVGLAAVGKISLKDAGAYLVAQFLGGAVALGLGGTLAARKALTAVDSAAVVGAEAVGAFLLAFGVASVVFGKTPAPAAGLVIGGSLFTGIAVAATNSNAVLNPAVALGIGSFSFAYVLGPLIGAVVAMFAYKFVSAD